MKDIDKWLMVVIMVFVMTLLMMYVTDSEAADYNHQEKAASFGNTMAQNSALELHNIGAPLEEIQKTVQPILQCTGEKYSDLIPYVDYTLARINKEVTEPMLDTWLMGIVSALYWQCVEEQ